MLAKVEVEYSAGIEIYRASKCNVMPIFFSMSFFSPRFFPFELVRLKICFYGHLEQLLLKDSKYRLTL